MSENGEVKGSLYRTEVIAQLFGVSVRRIQQLTQEGVIQDDQDHRGWKNRPKI